MLENIKKFIKTKRIDNLENELNKVLISIEKMNEKQQYHVLFDFKSIVMVEAKKRKITYFLRAFLLFLINVLILVLSFSVFHYLFSTIFGVVFNFGEEIVNIITIISFILTFLIISFFFKFWYELVFEKYKIKLEEVNDILKKLTLIRDALKAEVPESIKRHHYLNYLDEAKEYFKNKDEK